MSKKDTGKKSDAEILEAWKVYFAPEHPVGMPRIAKDLDIPQKELRARLRAAYAKGAIVIKVPENANLAQHLAENWPDVTYHVLEAAGEHFFRGAAEVFFQEMSQLLERRAQRRPLRIGVVSGRTTGGMIEAICNAPEKWKDLMPLHRLPKVISVYALNVSQIDGYDRLKGNANVLAYQLAHRFRAEVEKINVEAYGLSAKLLQTTQEVQESDCTAETRAVLEYTSPERLMTSLTAVDRKAEGDGLPQASQLDVVITGVGSVADSLFGEYLQANGFDVKKLRDDDMVVGDIAYCPITRTGATRGLRKENQEWEFYRAVSLEVLQEMSRDKQRKVIVVALNTPQSSKTDTIYAAIGGSPNSPKFCNVVITDDLTANDLKINWAK